jgi:hypothetical protein
MPRTLCLITTTLRENITLLMFFRAYDGHVYAKFVGSSNEYIAWSIWVPNTLFTNKRGPIEKWGPKIKT